MEGEVEDLYAKFHLNVFILRLPVAKNHNFGQILTFRGISVGLFYRPLAAKTPIFLPFLDFGI